MRTLSSAFPYLIWPLCVLLRSSLTLSNPVLRGFWSFASVIEAEFGSVQNENMSVVSMAHTAIISEEMKSRISVALLSSGVEIEIG